MYHLLIHRNNLTSMLSLLVPHEVATSMKIHVILKKVGHVNKVSIQVLLLMITLAAL